MNWNMQQEMEAEFNAGYDYIREAYASELEDLALMDASEDEYYLDWRHMERANLASSKRLFDYNAVEALCYFLQELADPCMF